MILNKITPDGQVQIVGTGFTTILGLAFDNRDRMYVLEDTYVPNATSPIFPTPSAGRIVRVNANGIKYIIATGFSLATAITYGNNSVITICIKILFYQLVG